MSFGRDNKKGRDKDFRKDLYLWLVVQLPFSSSQNTLVQSYQLYGPATTRVMPPHLHSLCGPQHAYPPTPPTLSFNCFNFRHVVNHVSEVNEIEILNGSGRWSYGFVGPPFIWLPRSAGWLVPIQKAHLVGPSPCQNMECSQRIFHAPIFIAAVIIIIIIILIYFSFVLLKLGWSITKFTA